MKKLLFILGAAMTLLLPTSCDKQLDINTNPLAASSADPNAVLPFVLVQYQNRTTSELSRIIDVYQNVSATFNSPRNGPTSSTLTGNMWGMLYTQVLGNLSLVEKDARAAGPTSNNVTAIAVILKALAFYDLTSMYGDIPFTQAVNSVEFPQPEFDDQETVLNGIVTYLEEASQLIDDMPASGNFNIKGDLIYGGNMANWQKFANSFKLRVLMMIRNKDTSVDAKIVTTLGEPLITNNTEAALFKYPNTPGNQNAYKQLLTAFGTGFNETSEFFGPSPVLRLLLEGDPRLQLYCVDGTDGNYRAEAIGTFPDQTSARISSNVLRGDLPDIWMLPAEVTFYRAELVLKGVVAGDANALYRQGVTQTLEFWGQDIPGVVQTLTDTDISTYVNSLTDINGLSQANALIKVGEQQYLEAFWRPILSWNHVRRTKVPDIQAAPGASITTMLKRFNYPPAEVAANPNTPANLLTDVPQWFEN